MVRSGRPAKDELTDEEVELALGILNGDGRGTGMRSAATAVSRHRKAHLAATSAVREQRTVSARWLERQLTKRGKMPSAAKVAARRSKPSVRRTGQVTDNPGPRIAPEGS